MNIENFRVSEFLHFLVNAKKNTYASEGEFSEKKLNDGTRQLTYEIKNFKYRDNYFGFNPFLGEEIVWFDNKILWGMNYYGKVFDKEYSEEIYNFLKKALKMVEKESPYRGPKILKEDKLKYINKFKGDYKNFIGKEIILYDGKKIYELKYHGGLIIEK